MAAQTSVLAASRPEGCRRVEYRLLVARRSVVRLSVVRPSEVRLSVAHPSVVHHLVAVVRHRAASLNREEQSPLVAAPNRQARSPLVLENPL
jgi:hypothetical protein